jgi:hypothetical protein
MMYKGHKFTYMINRRVVKVDTITATYCGFLAFQKQNRVKRAFERAKKNAIRLPWVYRRRTNCRQWCSNFSKVEVSSLLFFRCDPPWRDDDRHSSVITTGSTTADHQRLDHGGVSVTTGLQSSHYLLWPERTRLKILPKQETGVSKTHANYGMEDQI